jgi:hypothetical protein
MAHKRCTSPLGETSGSRRSPSLLQLVTCQRLPRSLTRPNASLRTLRGQYFGRVAPGAINSSQLLNAGGVRLHSHSAHTSFPVPGRAV